MKKIVNIAAIFLLSSFAIAEPLVEQKNITVYELSNIEADQLVQGSLSILNTKEPILNKTYIETSKDIEIISNNHVILLIKSKNKEAIYNDILSLLEKYVTDNFDERVANKIKNDIQVLKGR